MSYGSETKFKSLSLQWERHDGSPSPTSPTVILDTFSRTGSNLNVPFSSYRVRKNKRAIYKWEKYYYKSLKTVRIANPVYPKKSKKKFIYYKQYVRRFRLKKVIMRSANDSNVKPKNINSLNFVRSKLTISGGPTIRIIPVPGGSYADNWFRTVSGNTSYLGSFPKVGWGSGSPSLYNPDSYTASSLISSNTAIINRLRDASTRKIYSKAKDQHVNLQNFLAELHSTKSGFIGIVKRIAKMILAVKKGNFKTAYSTLIPKNSKDLADDVLLYKFGIAPLIGDLDGLMKHLAQNAKDNVCRVVAVSREVVKTTTSGKVPSSILSRKETLTTETEITVRSVLRYKVDAPAVNQLTQLGFTNPASTAWEVIPWSFVIDWLIPIGDYIDTLDTAAFLQTVSFHTTVYIRQKVVCTAVNGGISGAFPYRTTTSEGYSTWEKENVAVSRSLNAAVLPPCPIPRFKNPFSASHIGTAAALLRQLRR